MSKTAAVILALVVAFLLGRNWPSLRFFLPRPFRVHASDVVQRAMDGSVWKIKCPACNGIVRDYGQSKYDGSFLSCPECDGYLRVDVRFMARPVVVVEDTEPSDYARP